MYGLQMFECRSSVNVPMRKFYLTNPQLLYLHNRSTQLNARARYPNETFSSYMNKMEGLIYSVRYFRVIATGLIFLINITAAFADNNCADRLIGVENRYIIPDSSFTATSKYDDRYYPYHARLNSNLKGWLPRTQSDPNDYLQIDLGLPYVICAVATLGCSDCNEWVTQYKISLSMDNTNWSLYKENGAVKLFDGNTNYGTIKKNTLTKQLTRYIRFIPTKKYRDKTMRVGIYGYLKERNYLAWPTHHNKSGEKEFSGNSERTTVVTNAISNPFRARFVRVLPKEFKQWKILRVDFKGLPLGCTSSLGLENSQIPDSHLTSSSSSDNFHAASRGRLYGSSSWCSQTIGNNEYIQVDLGQVKTVTGIATQGNPHMNAWVTSYKVGYSFDNRYWNEYKQGQVVKNLEGNSDRNAVRVNWVRNPIAARYIRITPQTHNSGGGHCLRFEVYGCDIFVAPKVILDTVDFILPSIKGSSITLTCSVLGEPAPDIQWFNNGTKINGATQSTLQVRFISAEDVVSKYNCTRQDPNTRAVVCNTFYTCRATYPNYVPSGGMNEASGKVTVFLNVFKAPNVTAKLNKRSITTKWPAMTASDDVGTINSYNIQLSNQSSTVTYNAHHPALNYTIEHLKPYTNYSIRVKAISVVGQGLWSSWLDVRTLIAEPEGLPSITGENVLSSQSIQLHFQYSQLDLLHGPMTGFRIFYKPEGGTQQQIAIDVGNVNMTTLTNLKKYTSYNISVAVRNTMYVGPACSVTIIRTLEDAPDIGPQKTTATKINDTTFLVTWQPLTTAQSNGVVTKYEIFWSIDIEGGRSGRSLQDMFNTTTQATQYILCNLRFCANYTVSVRGYTSVGPGPKSTINILTSLAQPTDVQAESQTKTSIRVRWEKPLPLSLVVYEYTIEVKGSKPYWSNYSFSSTHKQNGARTNTVIDGLNPGTSYEFWVTALAACGKSEKSVSSKKDTDIDNPVKPTGNSITLKNKFDV
ncbi:uncharacterized protein LOC116294321, partial [Actinia tenebrosa]|uniref:Uncharacterized protein LOC116294321 n=1 Tax=Actinia tenebrosa TaxID=6105 RepID=A0A6P8HYN4_ACTTE